MRLDIGEPHDPNKFTNQEQADIAFKYMQDLENEDRRRALEKYKIERQEKIKEKEQSDIIKLVCAFFVVIVFILLKGCGR